MGNKLFKHKSRDILVTESPNYDAQVSYQDCIHKSAVNSVARFQIDDSGSSLRSSF